jgi:hypothetical protein
MLADSKPIRGNPSVLGDAMVTQTIGPLPAPL